MRAVVHTVLLNALEVSICSESVADCAEPALIAASRPARLAHLPSVDALERLLVTPHVDATNTGVVGASDIA